MSLLNLWKEMSEALLNLQAKHDAAFFGVSNTSSVTEQKPLTLADVEAAVRHIDPDGRHLQEGQLLSVCAKLTKEQVNTVIWCAEQMLHPIGFDVGFQPGPFAPKPEGKDV